MYDEYMIWLIKYNRTTYWREFLTQLADIRNKTVSFIEFTDLHVNTRWQSHTVHRAHALFLCIREYV